MGQPDRVRRLSDGTRLYSWSGRSRDTEGRLDTEVVVTVRPDGVAEGVSFSD
jgi:hypothetical protein